MVAEVGTVDGVGSRLLRVREQLGLALADLPHLTGGQFTAAAVGSYEREFRWPTVERMAALCGYYGAPLAEVLTGTPASPGHRDAPAAEEAATAPEIRALRRFAASVTRRRTSAALQAAATGVPRLRDGDFEVLAVVLDTSPARLRRLAAESLNGTETRG